MESVLIDSPIGVLAVLCGVAAFFFLFAQVTKLRVVRPVLGLFAMVQDLVLELVVLDEYIARYPGIAPVVMRKMYRRNLPMPLRPPFQFERGQFL